MRVVSILLLQAAAQAPASTFTLLGVQECWELSLTDSETCWDSGCIYAPAVTETDYLCDGYTSLQQARSYYCSLVDAPPEQLYADQEEPPQSTEVDSRADQVLATVRSWRNGHAFRTLARECAKDDGSCSRASSTYVETLFPFMMPMITGVFTIFAYHTCCWLACFRCCRRCCCCSERKEPRKAKKWQRRIAQIIFILMGLGVFGCSVSLYVIGSNLSEAANLSFCRLYVMSDEFLNGSREPPIFLGLDIGIQTLQSLAERLDVDGGAMQGLRDNLVETQPLELAYQRFTDAAAHMSMVLLENGHGEILDHVCSICRLLAGDNRTGDVGLLGEIVQQVDASPASSMNAIRDTVLNRLTGDSLTTAVSAVRNAEVSLLEFRRILGRQFVQPFVGSQDDFASLEDARDVVFEGVGAWAMVCVIVGLFALFVAKKSRRKYPAAQPSACAWCCTFIFCIVAQLVGGALLTSTIVMTEMCDFWENDVTTQQGYIDYAAEFELETNWTRAIAQTCMASTGTGRLTETFGLVGALGFQQELDQHYETFEVTLASKVLDNAKNDRLRTLAQDWGGYFQLNAKLALNPSGIDQLNMSTLFAHDRTSPVPSSSSTVFGLDTYANLIAGPGKYQFLHGTSGDAVMINSTHPTEDFIITQPVLVQHALRYAKQKEQLLETGAAWFRCDALDLESGNVTERQCDYESFSAHVGTLANQVLAELEDLGAEASAAQRLFQYDIREGDLGLNNILQQVRTLLSRFNCRFVWWRLKSITEAMCRTVTPSLLEAAGAWIAMACFSLIIIFIEYKVWRHLKDNRAVGLDIERYEKKYGEGKRHKSLDDAYAEVVQAHVERMG
mmetsp:Transcript_31200/g.70191  ORF Transcript_31200/g.70191 Transcript_31200/m.70191 type:complete len:843 (-) Transcript_31200:94-2622(-)|eukprot:CAMPEP_0204320450 /NCGR_PEP_ID=MMETSP0469-20131031/7648_1 /ASSEMBLY_ACC=CAM_ASM_000384 /TAXON_ID=2969 /ORGANISM="Oxyrrhis marina" /LENGTH=842 /DNA_ID=CAMNT_0051301715 /DNA_START=48 /DNA_END=2576 /DNA_ORIENTATION=-